MKILIVDDEPLARARLRELVEELQAGEVAGEATNGADALRLAESTSADLLLLDIRMPGMDGIEAARHLAGLDRPPAVVFTTAYDDQAMAAIEANAVAYLLKPIRRERLAVALARAQRLTRAHLAGLDEVAGGGRRPRTHLSATVHGDLQLVSVEDVRYLRAEHKYVTARHPGGELLIEDTLAALEVEFPERFLRVHRNALVAVAHLRVLERDAEGHQRLRFDGLEEAVEVSRRLASQVRRALKTR
jgi:two-component system response regulator AlgR